jgi:hypothetical protein
MNHSEKEAAIENIKKLQLQAKEITKELQLNCLMSKSDNNYIQIDYTITNHSSDSIFVLDQVIVFGETNGFEEEHDRAIVIQEEQFPHTVTFSRGYVRPLASEVMYELMPGARTLIPDNYLEGYIRMNVPLNAWHPNEGSHKLKFDVHEFRLKLGILPAFCSLDQIQLIDGSHVLSPTRVDAYLYQQWVISDVMSFESSE